MMRRRGRRVRLERACVAGDDETVGVERPHFDATIASRQEKSLRSTGAGRVDRAGVGEKNRPRRLRCQFVETADVHAAATVIHGQSEVQKMSAVGQKRRPPVTHIV
jgi:hypothetical protein